MNKLTQTVLNLQAIEKDSIEYDTLFSEVYYGVQASMEAIVNSYAYSLKGDVVAGESIAMEHILVCVKKFKYKGYEFLTFYKKTLKNKLIDLVRSVNAEKVRHMTSYDVSLSETVEGNYNNPYPVLDRYIDDSLMISDTYTEEGGLSIGNLLESYSLIKPKEAELLNISMMYSASNGYKKKDLGQAIAEFYGEKEYTNTLQQRLSRAIKNFKKFAINEGYNFNF